MDKFVTLDDFVPRTSPNLYTVTIEKCYTDDAVSVKRLQTKSWPTVLAVFSRWLRKTRRDGVEWASYCETMGDLEV